jgi:hypothetical protein
MSLIVSKIFEALKELYKDRYCQFAIKCGFIISGAFAILYFYRKIENDRRRKAYPKDKVILHQIIRGLRCPRFDF